ncbi:cytoplasmic protein, partial [Bacillus thuringiensis]
MYRFAIYKCPKDHTWNQKLRIYKAFTDHVETVDMKQQDQIETTTTISITKHKESGIAEITVVLDIVFGSHRMDKA